MTYTLQDPTTIPLTALCYQSGMPISEAFPDEAPSALTVPTLEPGEAA